MEIRNDIKALRSVAVTRTEFEDHEQRIRFLERWKYGIPATLIVAILGFASAISHS